LNQITRGKSTKRSASLPIELTSAEEDAPYLANKIRQGLCKNGGSIRKRRLEAFATYSFHVGRIADWRDHMSLEEDDKGHECQQVKEPLARNNRRGSGRGLNELSHVRFLSEVEM
jgi:hypothetical protein